MTLAARKAGPMLTIAGWNAVSRATGFLRVLSVTAVLGATFLGNAYQQANLVSTVLFEVLAAGLLSVPLVPALVARPESAARTVSALWGLSLAVLGGLALLLGLLGAPLMRLLTSAAPAAEAELQVALGSFLLWFFAPQLVLYAAGALATAWLHARRRFAAASAAPVANNLVVVATMAIFLAVENGETGLPVSTGGRIVLGVGTTLGVAAMAALPLFAVGRDGFPFRPRRWWGDPAIAAVAREGVWAGALLGAQQIVLGASLIVANRVEGGVVASQLAYAFFLLPQALLAHPVYTAALPALSASVAEGRPDTFRHEFLRSGKRLVLLLVPASLVLVLGARPLVGLVRVGAFDRAGVSLAAGGLRAYTLGLMGFGAYMLVCRAWAAQGRTRVPGLVSLATAGAGVLALFVITPLVPAAQVVVMVGLTHSLIFTTAAVILFVLLLQSTPVARQVAPTRATER